MASVPTSTGFILGRDEFLIICPYSASHQILNTKFPRHLANCREAYKKKLALEGRRVIMNACRYNYTHEVPYLELLNHETYCPNRTDVVTFISYSNTPEGKRKAAAEAAAAEAARAERIRAQAAARNPEMKVDPAAGVQKP